VKNPGFFAMFDSIPIQCGHSILEHQSSIGFIGNFLETPLEQHVLFLLTIAQHTGALPGS
jgi:hypothetical protein